MGTQFVNDYRYVDTYKNGVKVAGSSFSELTGESVNVSDTYNSDCSITINGKTIETGTGDKSPSNPYVLASVENFDLINYGNDNLFDLSAYRNKQSDGVTVSTYNLTILDDKVYALSGSAQTLARGYFFTLDPTKRWTFSYKSKKCADGASSRATFYVNGTAWAVREFSLDTYETQSWTPAVGTKNLFIGFDRVGNNNATNLAEFSEIMLNEGTVAKPYIQFKGNTINFPYTLRSLPDGVKDYIEVDDVAKTAKLVQNLREKIYDGTETGMLIDVSSTTSHFKVIWHLNGAVLARGGLCSHFAYKFANNDGTVHWYPATDGMYFDFPLSLGIVDQATWQAWSTGQFNAGTPLTIIFPLAAPIETQLSYTEIKQYYPQTQIYTTADVQPTLSGNFRIFSN